jgi:hypothetical protein
VQLNGFTPAELTPEQIAAISELEKNFAADKSGRKIYLLAVTCKDDAR